MMFPVFLTEFLFKFIIKQTSYLQLNLDFKTFDNVNKWYETIQKHRKNDV